MISYVIGMLYSESFDRVLLIRKTKPDWQAGNFNFPGGKIEKSESANDAIISRFKEETNLQTLPSDWDLFGEMVSKDREYQVLFFAGVYHPDRHGEVISLTEEMCWWTPVYALPKNIITNLKWLIPLGINYLQQGNNPDKINLVTIDYID
jgi:ADP-ribose pyrophosphatase YjhB (NUDIX family)